LGERRVGNEGNPRGLRKLAPLGGEGNVKRTGRGSAMSYLIKQNTGGKKYYIVQEREARRTGIVRSEAPILHIALLHPVRSKKRGGKKKWAILTRSSR